MRSTCTIVSEINSRASNVNFFYIYTGGGSLILESYLIFFIFCFLSQVLLRLLVYGNESPVKNRSKEN